MQLKKLRRRPLTIREILIWASHYREAHGKWPTKANGDIIGTHGETWGLVDGALRNGLRGLPGGSSLAKLLAEEKGARNPTSIQPLTEQQILAWADEHRQRTDGWPTTKSGIISNSGGEKWSAVDMALRAGVRGLLGGSSLARLLAEQRGVRNRKALPHLTEDQILSWCDLHQGRTGAWPNLQSGPGRVAHVEGRAPSRVSGEGKTPACPVHCRVPVEEEEEETHAGCRAWQRSAEGLCVKGST